MITGTVHRYGDNIDTDVIIPARYLNAPSPEELAKHCMEDIDPSFVSTVRCGSSREHAPIAIEASGISCVIAASFARIFYRNSINIGFPILECPEAAASIRGGDTVSVDFSTGIICDITTGQEFQAAAFPPFIGGIIEHGGLLPYLKAKKEAQP